MIQRDLIGKLIMSSQSPSDSNDDLHKARNGIAATAAETLKKLTVTFKDVAVEVDGLGEDFGSTCLSVVRDCLSFGTLNKSKRVCHFSKTID